MSISELFDSGFIKRNGDHFAAIVRVAMADGVISESEQSFLDRLAKNLNISDQEYKQTLEDYRTHPINPPVSYNHRIERLFDLVRMVIVDSIDKEDKLRILSKIAIGLGFSSTNVNYIIDKAIALITEGVDLEDFIDGIKNMNR